MAKGVGVLVLLGIASIFVLVYSQTYNASSNITLWSPLVTNVLNNYFPMLVGIIVVVLIVMGLILNKKR